MVAGALRLDRSTSQNLPAREPRPDRRYPWASIGAGWTGGIDPGSGSREASDGRRVVENHLTSGGSQFLVVAVSLGDTYREQSVVDSGTHVITTVPTNATESGRGQPRDSRRLCLPCPKRRRPTSTRGSQIRRRSTDHARPFALFKRTDEPSAVLLVDIDDLHDYNCAYGYLTGASVRPRNRRTQQLPQAQMPPSRRPLARSNQLIPPIQTINTPQSNNLRPGLDVFGTSGGSG